MAHTGAAETRKDRLAARLVEILVVISGRERSQISTSATFLEQDFDSLSLTQVAFAVRKEFGVKTTFSQLMNRQPNVDMMAEHLDKTLSPGLFTDAPAMPPTSTAPAISPPPASDAKPPEVSLKAVITKQADTIACLVSLLRNRRDFAGLWSGLANVRSDTHFCGADGTATRHLLFVAAVGSVVGVL